MRIAFNNSQRFSECRLRWWLTVCVVCWLAAGSAEGHGGYHEVLAELDVEISKHPQDGALLRKRSLLHLDHDDWRAALFDAERAKRLGVAEEELHGIRGRALAMAGLNEAALKSLDASVEAVPQDPAVRIARARVKANLGDCAGSLADYEALLSTLEAPAVDVLVECAEAFAAQACVPRALEILERGLKRVPEDPALEAKALEIELKAGRYDEALTRVDALRRQSPQPEPWMAKRAELLKRAGRDAESGAAWEDLRRHLMALPNLRRGTAEMQSLLDRADQALGASAQPKPVLAPPAASLSLSRKISDSQSSP